jgi:hypothetical protein
VTGIRALLTLPGRGPADDERQRRVARVMDLVERFVYDLGLLAAGRAVAIDDYVDASAAARLRNAVHPALRSGLTTHPDFGEYAQVRIDGNLLDRRAAVRTVVEFDDRSTRVDDHGRVVVRVRRHVRLLLVIDPEITRVVDHRLEIA